ncbi:Uncharacterised protein [Salmonella enterica subsp. arizonae]|nr:Uncharacterised protein [Salmonella enterica subsp. arizonae]
MFQQMYTCTDRKCKGKMQALRSLSKGERMDTLMRKLIVLIAVLELLLALLRLIDLLK